MSIDRDWRKGVAKENTPPPADVTNLRRAQATAAQAGAILPNDPDGIEPEKEPAASPNPEPWARPKRRRKRDGERWVDLHTRRTFILPNDLSADIDEVVGADEELSFASAATEAFRDWVAKQRRLARKTKGTP